MHSYLYPPATLAKASRLRFPTGTPSRLIYREPPRRCLGDSLTKYDISSSRSESSAVFIYQSYVPGHKRTDRCPVTADNIFYLLLRCGDDTSHRCKDVPTHQCRCEITQKGLKASRSDGAPPHHPNTSSLILSLQYQYNILTLFITN